jgi:arsenate reductase-like glutaredoxin family protein
MILTDEQEKKIEELAVVTGISIEDIKKTLTNFVDVANNLWTKLKDLFETISENINYLSYQADKPDWNTPKKIVMESQVLIRRPLLIRARSNC